MGREREERGRKEKIRKKKEGRKEKKFGCLVNLNIRSTIRNFLV